MGPSEIPMGSGLSGLAVALIGCQLIFDNCDGSLGLSLTFLVIRAVKIG